MAQPDTRASDHPQPPHAETQASHPHVETQAVSSARNMLTDVVEATGDFASTTVRAAVDVGEEVIHGVGTLGNEAVVEVSRLFINLASGVRSTLGTIMSGRAPDPVSREASVPARQSDRTDSRT